MSVYVIVAAGGQGTRLGGELPKQWRSIAGRTMFERTVDACAAADVVDGLVVVVPDADRAQAERLLGEARLDKPYRVVAGGARRQDSVAQGAAALPPEASVVLVHDAARPFVTPDVVARVAEGARQHGAAIAAVPVHDSVKRVAHEDAAVWCAAGLPRDEVYLAQTPQGFRRSIFDEVVALGHQAADATDEATLAERAGHRVCVVDGDPGNVKVTTPRDLAEAERRLGDGGAAAMRVGVGYDSHRFDASRSLWLAGVHIAEAPGLAGHSDGDAVCHAVTDAILGAVGLGDIGGLFPDTDPAWKDADSLALLRDATGRVRAAGYRVGNVDIAVVCERPKIGAHAAEMRASLASALDCAPAQVFIKGKTPEGTPGLADSLVVHVVALLTRSAS